MSLQGRHGAAVKEFESAITLDPLSPVMHEDYGFGMLLARRFDKAIEQNKKALELEPEFFNAARWLMWASIGKGDHDAAAAWFERYLRLIHHPMDAVTTFRRTYEVSGLRAGFVGLLDSQGSTEDVPGPAMRAAIYAWCNEKDRAFEWLERAFERQVPVVFSVASHPAFDNLHDDPRFDDLLRKMGLDQVDLSVPPTTP